MHIFIKNSESLHPKSNIANSIHMGLNKLSFQKKGNNTYFSLVGGIEVIVVVHRRDF